MNVLLPTVGLSKLKALQHRERLCHVAWGAARFLALVVAVLAITTTIDWIVDRSMETPRLWVRNPLTVLQIMLFGYFAYRWLVLPWLKAPDLILLARRVEEQIPDFGHRLVTSIQLSEDKAARAGMSVELLGQLTNESETLAQQHRFSQFADIRRFKWAAACISIPLVLLAALLIWHGPETLEILVKRQFFGSQDIPRTNQLENLTPELWAAGDKVIIRYRVTGEISDQEVGRLRVKPDGLPADRYQLTFEREEGGAKIFRAEIPHSSINFTHRAWIGDGRTKSYHQVIFEPRPVVSQIDAWVQLPGFLGVTPSGKPYESYQTQGEIIGLPSSQARIRITAQKKLSEAVLVLYRRSDDGTREVPLEEVLLNIDEVAEAVGQTQYTASGQFLLRPELVRYRVVVKDVYGFDNSTPPARGIQIAADDPPVVNLLPERYLLGFDRTSEEDIIEGLPIPLGGKIPIAYLCRSPNGVGKAQLRYRVNDESNFRIFPLSTIAATEKTGSFNPNTGAFMNTSEGEQVEFHPIPSLDPVAIPSYLSGGGRFDFNTGEVTKLVNGSEQKLQIGDRVEYFVEVFDRNPALVTLPGGRKVSRPPGQSETRMKEILSATDVLLRLDQIRQTEEKIRDLEKKQRDIFHRESLP
ncbi:MAG: hypothetical protein R3B84_18145 [Zavarzinella sp.]